MRWLTNSTSSSPIAAPSWSAIPAQKAANRCAASSNGSCRIRTSSSGHCEEAPRGLHVLYEDPELGFQVLAHINDKARVSPPHDHGNSWAIYGQATHYTDMTEWEREDDGRDPQHAKLKPVKKYRLMPGHAGIYQDGKIHSIDYPDHARFVRVDRNESRSHRSRALRSEHRRSQTDDAAAGDVTDGRQPRRPAGHPRGRRRARARRRARRADLFARPPVAGALGAAQPAGAEIRAAGAARATRRSCCATTTTALPSARRQFWRATAIPICASWPAAWRPGRRPGLSCSPASMCRAKPSANSSNMTKATPSIAADELAQLLRGRTPISSSSTAGRSTNMRGSRSPHDQCSGRGAGAARERDCAVSRQPGRGQLRRSHPQHYRRAVADQRRPAEQSRRAAQRHHGLDPCRIYLRQRKDKPCAARLGEQVALGARRGVARGGGLRGQAHRSGDA